MVTIIRSIAMRLQAADAQDDLARYLKYHPQRESLAKKLEWFWYRGPEIRWGPPVGRRPQTFYLNKNMLMGIKPQGQGALVLVPVVDTSTVIPMDLARKIAQHVKPAAVGVAQSRSVTLPSGKVASPKFLESLFLWFYGAPVKDKAFYSEVSSWPSQRAKCFRVMLANAPTVGQRIKLGPLSIYSGSTSPTAAANGWYNWAETNNTLHKIPKGSVPVLVEFASAEIKATTAQLKPLVTVAAKGRSQSTVDTLLHFKEVWLAGGQTGKIVKILDLQKLDKLYGW